MIYKLYTDGACSGNPGPAGIGFVLLWPGGKRAEAHYIGEATNNIAEFKSIIYGLRIIKNKNDSEVNIVTDSQLAIGIFSKNWKATANLELVKEIKNELKKFKKITFTKVKGHSNNPANEFCNKLAQEITKTKSPTPVIHGSLPNQ